MPLGVVTISRRCFSDDQMPKWSKCNASFKNTLLRISSVGTIEDQGNGLLQVDFANRYLGGGVLGLGCVQEEIRFVLCPEMFITRLIAESLRPNEAIFMIGCERFCEYSGYSRSFSFEGICFNKNYFIFRCFSFLYAIGEHRDDTPWDNSRRKLCAVVGIDALKFRSTADQFKADLMLRELNKVKFFLNLLDIC